MTKFPVAAGIALALVAGSALAADLPSRKGPPPAYIPPPPAFSWTGLYGGINIGYGFSAGGVQDGGLTVLPPATANHFAFWSAGAGVNGVAGGGQVGYNYQFNPWFVVGLEADIQAADINGVQNLVGPMPAPNNAATQASFVNSAKYVDWFGTVRGRLGVTLPSYPNLMVYGTGGFAYGGVNHTVGLAVVNSGPGAGSMIGKGVYDGVSTGWTAGGGVEWTPLSFPAWSLKVEYLYTNLGSTRVAASGPNANGFYYACCVFAGAHQAPTDWHTVRAGLNWHFNPFAAAPVVAKY
ncbi:outer membrane protein [Methylocystis parvus]|uniref:Porin family protein n=1 Tax=Methylocystis parvus TaxID=134 RepID=A0A6B8M3N4_9HYPH|nr:outer membrane beta-barrel protein [Methylocystis parvus]QGM96986.1 porin family protein [Methylocystis parvus]WBJ99123.1 outer membrane beta-barrel protein [Methylocystis parvus OBBP]